MRRTVETRVTALSHRPDFATYTFEAVFFPYYGRYDLNTFSQVMCMYNNNASMRLANYTLTGRWDTLRRTLKRCGSLLHDVLCCRDIEEIICRMTYADIFMRNGAAVPDGVYVTSLVAFGTDEPQELRLMNKRNCDCYNIADIFYDLPLALFTVEGRPVPDYEKVDNVLAHGYGPDWSSDLFQPDICFQSHGEAGFLDDIPLQTVRDGETISLDANGYATPLQYFDMSTFLDELGMYNMRMQNDWLGDELSEYGPVRFLQPYVTFTVQMNGVNCDSICSIGMERQEESIVPPIPHSYLVDDEDVLCA
jgi:hypothetical protein